MEWGPLEIKRARRPAKGDEGPIHSEPATFLPAVTLASLPDAAHAVIASFLDQVEVVQMAEVSCSFQATFRVLKVRIGLVAPPRVGQKEKDTQEDDACGVRRRSSLDALCLLLRSTPRLKELSIEQDDDTVLALAAALRRATAPRPWSRPQPILPCLNSLSLLPVGWTSLDALMVGIARGAFPVLEEVELSCWRPVDLREGLIALSASWEARMEAGYPPIKALRLNDLRFEDDDDADDGPLPPLLQRSAAFNALERLEVDVRSMGPFAPWLQQQRGLHHLRHVEINASTGVDELLEAILDSGAPEMTSMILNCCEVDGALIRRMAESVMLGCWRKLEMLEVKKVYGYHDTAALASLMTAMGSVEGCHRLRVLVLDDCDLQDGLVLVAMGHCDFSRLKELKVLGKQCEVTELRELFAILWDNSSTATHITDLHIDYNSDDDEAVEDFTRDATLAKRFLHACQLGAFSALRTLRVLFTYSPTHHDALAELLRSGWGSRLEEVDLQCVDLTEGACEAIRRVVAQNACPKLKLIRLAG